MRFIIAALLLCALGSQANAAETLPLGNLAATLLHGCWTHEEFQFPEAPGETPKLIRSQLACFNDKGVATGVAFHDGDAWEWIDRYALEDGSLVVGGQSWGHVLDASATKLILVKRDVLRAYDLVCRAPGEGVQCERLQYKIEQSHRQRRTRAPP